MITGNNTNVKTDDFYGKEKQQWEILSEGDANKIETDKIKLDDQAKDSLEDLDEIQMTKVETQNVKNSDGPNLENGATENGPLMPDSEQKEVESQLNRHREVPKSANLDIEMEDSGNKGEVELHPRINGWNCSMFWGSSIRKSTMR